MNIKKCIWIVQTILYSSILIATPNFIITPQDIASGLTITQPGIWQLQENANVTVNTAITISSSNVTLDLNGKELNGQNQSNTAIVVAGVQDITVKNGILKNFVTNGVHISLSTRVFVCDCRTDNVAGNSFSASESTELVFCHCSALLSQSNGFLIDNTNTNVLLDGCYTLSCQSTGYSIEASNYTIQKSGAHTSVGNGMYLGGTGGYVVDTFVREATENGIEIGGSNIAIEKNKIGVSSGNGVYVNGDASNIEITECQITENTGYGISAASVFSTTASKNIVTNNTAGDYNQVIPS